MTGLPLITCPACLAEYGLEAGLGQDDARGVVRELARCPADAATRKALMRYAALHAPRKQRLRWSRVEAILAEINGWMEVGRIEHGGRLWAAPATAFRAAIETIEAKPDLTRPLSGHGLLLKILAGMGDRAEARAERVGEDRLAGRTPGRGELGAGSRNPLAPPPLPTPHSQGERGKPRRTQAAADAIAKSKSILTPKAGRDAGATPTAGKDAGATPKAGRDAGAT